MKEQFPLNSSKEDVKNLDKKHAVISVRENPEIENTIEIEEEEVIPRPPTAYEKINSIHQGNYRESGELMDNTGPGLAYEAYIDKKRAVGDKLLDTVFGEGLEPEDLKLQQTIYEQTKKCEEWLKEKLLDKNKDEERKRNLEDFKRNPYTWMRMDLRSRIVNSEIQFKKTKNKDEQQRIRKGIQNNLSNLINLTQAYDKNIPLKLERPFNAREINLDNGRLFKVEENTQELNKYLGEENKNYEIMRVIARKNKDLIVFRTEGGKWIEIGMSACEEILRRKNKLNYENKEDNSYMNLKKAV